MMVNSSFRRVAGGAGLAALLVLVLAGVAEAAFGDCSGQRDHAMGHAVEVEPTDAHEQNAHGPDAPVPTEDDRPCCDRANTDEGETPDRPGCPHLAMATGCAGSGSLPALPTEPLNDAVPVDLCIPALTDTPVSAFAAPPFQPPRA